MNLINEYLCYMEIDKIFVIYDIVECLCYIKEINGSDLCFFNICVIGMVMNLYIFYLEFL